MRVKVEIEPPDELAELVREFFNGKCEIEDLISPEQLGALLYQAYKIGEECGE